jgi:hypothetical protein
LAVLVEDVASGRAQRRHAAAATSTLLLAAHDAGWRAEELAEAAGLNAPAVRRRIRVARDRNGDRPPAWLFRRRLSNAAAHPSCPWTARDGFHPPKRRISPACATEP